MKTSYVMWVAVVFMAIGAVRAPSGMPFAVFFLAAQIWAVGALIATMIENRHDS